MSVLDFLRDIGKHFPVNRMLARDVVRNRLEEGISYTEFSYVLLQSLDYLELYRSLRLHAAVRRQRPVGQHHRRRRADPAGRRSSGARHGDAAAHQGRRHQVRQDRDAARSGSTRRMTSPYAFHQFFLNAEDEKVIEYLKVFSERSREEIAELERQTRGAAAAARGAAGTGRRRHGAGALAGGAGCRCPGGRRSLRPLRPPASCRSRCWPDVVAEVGAAQLEANGDLPTVVEVLAASGVVASKSAARRAIAEGGAYVNNQRVTDPGRQARGIRPAARALRHRPPRQADGRRRDRIRRS